MTEDGEFSVGIWEFFKCQVLLVKRKLIQFLCININAYWCKIYFKFTENREGLESSVLLFKRLLAVNNIESDLEFWKRDLITSQKSYQVIKFTHFLAYLLRAYITRWRTKNVKYKVWMSTQRQKDKNMKRYIIKTGLSRLPFQTNSNELRWTIKINLDRKTKTQNYEMANKRHGSIMLPAMALLLMLVCAIWNVGQHIMWHIVEYVFKHK